MEVVEQKRSKSSLDACQMREVSISQGISLVTKTVEVCFQLRTPFPGLPSDQLYIIITSIRWRVDMSLIFYKT